MPVVHSKFNDKELQNILNDKSRDLLTKEQGAVPSFIFLSGSFFDIKGFAYTGLRAWRGAVKPSITDEGRRPLLEATFASLSVYLSSLLALQADFFFAFEEIKDILINSKREDLWTIVSEKLPFVSLPPKEMYGNQISPISPYLTILRQGFLSFINIKDILLLVFLILYLICLISVLNSNLKNLMKNLRLKIL